jgi:hypothetical protein
MPPGPEEAMIDLTAIRKRDYEIHGIVEEFMPLAAEFARVSPIPKTANVFLSFITRTEFIKNGILDLAETENVYAAKILFRSHIEHFLRFQYIWFRVCEEKSDATAEQYSKFSSFKEGLLIGKSWKRVAKILGMDSRLPLMKLSRPSSPKSPPTATRKSISGHRSLTSQTSSSTYAEKSNCPRTTRRYPFLFA